MLITMTVFADFLNTFFAGFDDAIINFAHNLHEVAGAVLDPILTTITHLGDHGLFFILLTLVLLFIPKTRKIGMAMTFAALIGVIITNVAVKNLVARVRPYEASELYRSFFQVFGIKPESDWSFPSGHTNIAFSTMTAFFLAGNKKYSWLALVLAALVAFSRIYIVIHYPTDVFAGLIIGVLSGVAGFLIMSAVYKKYGERIDASCAKVYSKIGGIFKKKNKPDAQ